MKKSIRSIVERDPEFAKVYLREKEELLKVLVNADDLLLKKAWEQVTEKSLQNKKAS